MCKRPQKEGIPPYFCKFWSEEVHNKKYPKKNFDV
jgi:hypothetical protein